MRSTAALIREKRSRNAAFSFRSWSWVVTSQPYRPGSGIRCCIAMRQPDGAYSKMRGLRNKLGCKQCTAPGFLDTRLRYAA